MTPTSAENPVSTGLPDVPELTRRLGGKPLKEMLPRIVEAFAPGRLATISAFGPGSMVILHTLHELGIRLPVIFIDTLHHFPETLELVERATTKYDLDLRVFRPAATRAEFEGMYGAELWKTDLDRYQKVAKVEPFARATADLDGWITGRRREQSATRSGIPLIEEGAQLRINPLAEWTRTDVWSAILAHDIPYNPLLDRGFTSIGDEPLTTAVKEGEDERAGRWRGSDRTECGIHGPHG